MFWLKSPKKVRSRIIAGLIVQGLFFAKGQRRPGNMMGRKVFIRKISKGRSAPGNVRSMAGSRHARPMDRNARENTRRTGDEQLRLARFCPDVQVGNAKSQGIFDYFLHSGFFHHCSKSIRIGKIHD